MPSLIANLRREPAAVGTLISSLLPALVLMQVVHLDEQAIAALVVAVNALVAFFVRMTVTPGPAPALPEPQPERAAA
jgi:outer membrane biosynthesis protein TonB